MVLAGELFRITPFQEICTLSILANARCKNYTVIKGAFTIVNMVNRLCVYRTLDGFFNPGLLDPSEVREYLSGPGLSVEVHDRDRVIERQKLKATLFGDDFDDEKISNVGTVASSKPDNPDTPQLPPLFLNTTYIAESLYGLHTS